MFRQKGAEFFNPDEAAKRILFGNPAITQKEANGAAWNEGKRLVERAIPDLRKFPIVFDKAHNRTLIGYGAIHEVLPGEGRNHQERKARAISAARLETGQRVRSGL